MRKAEISLIVLLVAGLYSGSCQQPQKPGSLRTGEAPHSRKVVELSLVRSTDTADANLLLRTAAIISSTQTDSAIALYREALHLCKELRYFSAAACAYNNLACCHLQKGAFAEAMTYNNKGINYLEQVISSPLLRHRPEELRKLYRYLVDFYSYTDKHQKIIETYRLARPLFYLRDSLQSEQFLGLANRAATAYFRAGYYDSASAIYTALLSGLKPANKYNYSTTTLIYMGSGAVASELYDYNKAHLLFKKAALLAATYNDTNLIATALNNRATLFFYQKQYQKAKVLAFQALALSIHLPARQQIQIKYYSAYTLALSLMDEEKPGAALPYSTTAVQLAENMQLPGNKISAYYLLGTNYVRLKQYKKAEKHLLLSTKWAKDNGASEMLASAYGQLGITYARMRNFEKAYDFNFSYAALRDRLRGKENAAQVAEINARYEITKKDKALAEKQVKIESQQKKLYLWTGASLLFLVILLAFLWRRQHRMAQEKFKATLAGEERERSRIARELHDGIVSRLSVIKTSFSALPQYYREDDESLEFQEIIHQLDQSITELRATSHNLLPEFLKRAGLEETLRIYCENISKGSRLKITFQSNEFPALNDEFQLNIYRIIQEFIQNIIKHSGATQALIQFDTKEDTLSITIDDNGAHQKDLNGLAPAGNGIGLQNLCNRIQLLNGSMEIEHFDAGSSVYLEFDLKKSGQKG